jgi:hypothetical protein
MKLPQPNISVTCLQPSVEHGDIVFIEIETEYGVQHENIQIDIFECAVANPSPVWGSRIFRGHNAFFTHHRIYQYYVPRSRDNIKLCLLFQ